METLQSHSLHLCFLVLPDLMNAGSIFPLIQSRKDIVIHAARIKGLANDLCDCIGGRRLPPTRTVVGGFTKLPDKKELSVLNERLVAIKDDLMVLTDLFGTFRFLDFRRETEFVSLKGSDHYPFIGGDFVSSDGVQMNEQDYKKLTNEYMVAPPRPPSVTCPSNRRLYRDLTVDEYLDYCAALNRIERNKQRAARDAAKQKCGLAEVGRRLIGNLSKGYQQRVGIAQAIIHLPPVIILDEPTAGLDPIQIREIRHLVRELGKEHSVILSTHILTEVQTVCNHVQIINKGELVLNVSSDDLAQRLQLSVLTVRFRNPPDSTAIATLPGVKNVENTDGGSLRVYHDPANDPTEALVKQSVEQHCLFLFP